MPGFNCWIKSSKHTSRWLYFKALGRFPMFQSATWQEMLDLQIRFFFIFSKLKPCGVWGERGVVVVVVAIFSALSDQICMFCLDKCIKQWKKQRHQPKQPRIASLNSPLSSPKKANISFTRRETMTDSDVTRVLLGRYEVVLGDNTCTKVTKVIKNFNSTYGLYN